MSPAAQYVANLIALWVAFMAILIGLMGFVAFLLWCVFTKDPVAARFPAIPGRHCPKCGAVNHGRAVIVWQVPVYGQPNAFECDRCGYSWSFPRPAPPPPPPSGPKAA